MSRLGIAVVTYERRELLERLVDEVVQLTRSPYELVVADDGSEDGTADWCRARRLRVVTGPNSGIAWNKNRGLFALQALGCDPILLLEDDVHPVVDGWDLEWIEATRRWHHLGFHHSVIAEHVISGAGTAENPFVNPGATAQCLSVSAEALEQVGYFDSRFIGYGHEHAEWTTRIKRAGYGFQAVTLPDGRAFKAQLYISGGLVEDKTVSHRDERTVEANRELQTRIQGEPVFRCPWRTSEARATFLAEQAHDGTADEPLAAHLDMASATSAER